MTAYVHVWQYVVCSILLRTRNISDKSCRENQNTTFVFNNCLLNCYRWWDNVNKCRRVVQITENNIIGRMRFAYWVTTATDMFRMCNTCCSVTTMMKQTRPNVTLYLRGLHCFPWLCSPIETSFISRPNWDFTWPHWTAVCGSVYQRVLARRPLWASKNNYGFSHTSLFKYILSEWYIPKLIIYVSELSWNNK
jgi:hypothetical protein